MNFPHFPSTSPSPSQICIYLRDLRETPSLSFFALFCGQPSGVLLSAWGASPYQALCLGARLRHGNALDRGLLRAARKANVAILEV